MYPIVSFAYQYQPEQPDEEEGIRENLVEYWHRYKKRDNPNRQVDVEQDIPYPFAVVEDEGGVAVASYLDGAGGRERKVYAAPAFAQTQPAAELHPQTVAASRNVEFHRVALHGAVKEPVDENDVRQSGLIPVAVVMEGEHGGADYITEKDNDGHVLLLPAKAARLFLSLRAIKCYGLRLTNKKIQNLL